MVLWEHALPSVFYTAIQMSGSASSRNAVTGSPVRSCAVTLMVKIEIFTRYITLKACRINYVKENRKGSSWANTLTKRREKIRPKKQICVLCFHQILTSSREAFIIQMKIFGLFIRVQRWQFWMQSSWNGWCTSETLKVWIDRILTLGCDPRRPGSVCSASHTALR